MLIYFASLKDIFINFLIYTITTNPEICRKNQKTIFFKIIKIFSFKSLVSVDFNFFSPF